MALNSLVIIADESHHNKMNTIVVLSVPMFYNTELRMTAQGSDYHVSTIQIQHHLQLKLPWKMQDIFLDYNAVSNILTLPAYF
jgi:hypothetical protein